MVHASVSMRECDGHHRTVRDRIATAMDAAGYRLSAALIAMQLRFSASRLERPPDIA
jgi:hypothetical protein